ncbi:DUF11 domain-containing protein [Catellatospora tritici]|uniref:DUF11 domain-containing protein n=1 Tax=Catellatospora tritici TaxID=2851566 RepID=UPI001C2DD56C|nr:DUF11 domain-containing protein [Catellatospora tritici]MBV1852869.1 DUF11 domain-containing protein [Catellatospora tritici]
MSPRRLLAAQGALLLAGGLAASLAPDPARAAPHPTTGSPARTAAQALPVVADLYVNKADFPDPVLAGRVLTYTIEVGNRAGGAVPTVTLVDQLPTDFVPLTPLPSGCVFDQTTFKVTCTITNLQPDQVVPIALQLEIPSSLPPGILTNKATVSANNVVDPVAGNNTATQTTTVERSADLAVTKVCKPDKPAPAGTGGFCTIYVDNLGPSDAVGVMLHDTLSSATPFQVVSVGTQPVARCAPTSTGPVTDAEIQCNLGTIPPGRRAAVRVAVNAPDVSQINDVVRVDGNGTDPNLDNNEAIGRVEFVGSADLSLDKTGPETALGSSELTYEITVTNNGPSTAHDVVVRDTLPAGVSFVSVTPSKGSCTNGQPPGRDLVCGLGNLANGESVLIKVVGRLDADAVTGTILFNEAVVSSATADPDNDDVLKSVKTTVTADADLSVTKDDDPDPVLAGDQLVYTITASNAGPSTAQQVKLEDTLPPDTEFVSGVDAEDNSVCVFQGPDQVVCQLGDLASGASKTVTITVAVDPSVEDGTTLTNEVTVSSTTPDSNTDNNTASTDTDVETSADLWIEAAGLAPGEQVARVKPDEHQQIAFLVTVHNDKGCAGDSPTAVPDTRGNCGEGGPSDAQNVTVVDRLPLSPDRLEVQYVSRDCDYDEQRHVVTCHVDTIAAGSTAQFVIKAKVLDADDDDDDARTEGKKKDKDKERLVNIATVSSSTPDPDPANNTVVTVLFLNDKDRA